MGKAVFPSGNNPAINHGQIGRWTRGCQEQQPSEGWESLAPAPGRRKTKREIFLKKTAGLSGFLGREFSSSLRCPNLLLLLLVIHRIPFQAKSCFPSLGIFHPKLSSILLGCWEPRPAGAIPAAGGRWAHPARRCTDICPDSTDG